ncbi:MAG: hypothetical protein IK100_08815 [Muribaculaceae bacterium]|nr:hypothetical protein [Muribaculaceae bacterium]
MKKTFFVLALMIASMLSVQAQNLTKTAWTTMIPGDQELEMVLNFEEDGECYIILTIEEFQELEEGMNMIIRSSLAVPGIYDQDERDITLSFNKKKSEFSYDIDITGADSQAKSLFKSMIEPELKKLEPEMKEQMLLLVPPIMNDMKVISVSKNKLILRDSTGEELTFYPAAKG